MPTASIPPATGRDSNIVTSWPIFVSSHATVKPAGPEPMTATRLPVFLSGLIFGNFPKSAANLFRVFIAMGSPVLPLTHTFIQNAGHTLPQVKGNGLVSRIISCDFVGSPSIIAFT